MAQSGIVMVENNPGPAFDPNALTGWLGFVERHFERLLQLLITLLLIVPAWLIVMCWWESNPHLILGTNIISGVMGFWIGSSYGSGLKDKVIAALKGGG